MITLFSILLVVSVIFKLFPPRSINSFYGYRTKRSMKNTETWKLANEYSANLMVTFMTPLFVLSLLFHFFNLEFDTLLYVLLGLSFVGIIISTEKKLYELQFI